MTTDKQTHDNAWLEQFDTALSEHVRSHPITDTRIRDAVIQRLERQRKLRIFMPLCALIIAGLIAGPQLWRLLTAISARVPKQLSMPQLSIDSVLTSATQVPLYAWLTAALLVVIIEHGLRDR